MKFIEFGIFINIPIAITFLEAFLIKEKGFISHLPNFAALKISHLEKLVPITYSLSYIILRDRANEPPDTLTVEDL